MNEHNDQIDRAIDIVANKMVSVTADQLSAEQIVSQLPERSAGSWFGGFRLQLVGGAIAVIAILILSFGTIVRHDRSTRSFDPGVSIARVEPPSGTIAPNVFVERPSRTTAPNDRAERSGRTSVPNDTFDRDYGLPPVSAPPAIVLKSIAVETDLTVPASELAPLVLSELPSLDESRD